MDGVAWAPWYRFSIVVCFRAPGPDCPLHAAITHLIKVLEPQSSRELQWQLARKPLQSHIYYNTNHVSDCSVQRATGTRNPETAAYT